MRVFIEPRKALERENYASGINRWVNLVKFLLSLRKGLTATLRQKSLKYRSQDNFTI